MFGCCIFRVKETLVSRLHLQVAQIFPTCPAWLEPPANLCPFQKTHPLMVLQKHTFCFINLPSLLENLMIALHMKAGLLLPMGHLSHSLHMLQQHHQQLQHLPVCAQYTPLDAVHSLHAILLHQGHRQRQRQRLWQKRQRTRKGWQPLKNVQ